MRRLLTSLVLLAFLALPGAALAADPLRSQQYGLDLIEADAAHSTATGRGAIIAIIDTGVDASHPDLQDGRLLPGRDFVDDDETPEDEVDGHGTHVLGIAGATKDNGIGVSSVAPGAQLLPVRVLDDDGSGFTSDVVKGIDYAVAQGAHVINLSLGGSVPAAVAASPEFEDAIGRALDAGRVVIAASGNEMLPLCNQPSGEGRLLCVGSVDENGMRSAFSNFAGNSEALGIMAPGGSGFEGQDIVSTFNRDEPGDGYNGKYTELAGTSQATPHVAGVAALLVELGLEGPAATQRMLDTATAPPLGAPGEYGAGIVNARAAVAGLVAPGGAPGSGDGGDSGGTPGTGEGGGTGDQGGPAPPSGDDRPRDATRISLRQRFAIRRVLRRGFRARCRASRPGRCRLVIVHRGRRLAAGSRRLGRGRTRVVTARVNRRGRRLLRRALRRDRRIAVRARVRLPGASASRRIVLRP